MENEMKKQKSIESDPIDIFESMCEVQKGDI